MNVLSSLLVLCFVFMTLGHARVCVNLKPYEAILNGQFYIYLYIKLLIILKFDFFFFF